MHALSLPPSLSPSPPYRIKFREHHLLSPLLFKIVKSKIHNIHRTTIWTTLLYWCQVWSSSLRKEHKLWVFVERVSEGVAVLNICILRASNCMKTIHYVLSFLHIWLRTQPQIYHIRTHVLAGWQPNLVCIIQLTANNSAPTCTKRKCDKVAWAG